MNVKKCFICFKNCYTCFDLACDNENLLIAKYLLESTDVNITLKGVTGKKFIQIVSLIQNNCHQLNRLLSRGIKKYSKNTIINAIKKINPLKIQKHILDFCQIKNPFDNKFSEFVKIVDNLDVPIDSSHMPGAKIIEKK